jgi:ubiquinone biosynthesis protein UbiJ
MGSLREDDFYNMYSQSIYRGPSIEDFKRLVRQVAKLSAKVEKLNKRIKKLEKKNG